MSDPAARVRDALAGLARGAPRPQGAATAARAVALDRSLRRRRRVWAAGAVGVLLLGAGVQDGSRVLGPADPAVPAEATLAITVDVDAAGLYDVRRRGSLARDRDFLTAMAGVPWNGPVGPDGQPLGTDPRTVRVLYAADVPGGLRWTVVMGRRGTSLLWAWFSGPAGAAPPELTLQATDRLVAEQPIVLLDARGVTGALLVLGLPGDTARYSPSLDRDATGQLVRAYGPLPEVDGALLGVVTTPVVPGAGSLELRRDGGLLRPQSTSELTAAEPPAGPPGDPLRVGEAMEACLEPLGFQVTVLGDGALSVQGGPSGVGPLSTAEQAVDQEAYDRCAAQHGYR